MKVICVIRKSVLTIMLMGTLQVAHGQTKNYFESHKIIASLLSEFYGIPTPVILAVAAVESSAGNGPVAKVLNNHFGIVGKNDIVNKKGNKSRYKQYNNVFESYLDFCQVISRKSFYDRLRDKNDVEAWVTALSHAGYAEQPEEWKKNIFKMLASNKK